MRALSCDSRPSTRQQAQHCQNAPAPATSLDNIIHSIVAPFKKQSSKFIRCRHGVIVGVVRQHWVSSWVDCGCHQTALGVVMGRPWVSSRRHWVSSRGDLGGTYFACHTQSDDVTRGADTRSNLTPVTALKIIANSWLRR